MHHDHSHCGNLSCGCQNVVFDLFSSLRSQPNVPMGQALCQTGTESQSDQCSIFYNGTIRPVTGGDSSVVYEAMAVRGSKVAGVGSFDEMKGLFEGQEEVCLVNLNGKCLIPGLIDPHVHIVPTAYTYALRDLSPFDENQKMRQNYDLQWVKSQLKEAASQLPEHYWVAANGLDTSLLQDLMFQSNLLTVVNKNGLDSVVNDRPVFIMSASGHTAYLNSKALDATWAYVEDPENQNKPAVKEFKTAFPTKASLEASDGVLQELAQMLPPVMAIYKPQIDEVNEQLGGYIGKLIKLAQKRGVTMLYDAGMNEPSHTALSHYLQQNTQPKLHIGMAAECSAQADVKSVIKQIGDFKRPNEDTIDFYFGSIKLISDGSNQGLTGYQSQAYSCLPFNNYGICNYIDNGKQQIELTPPKKETPPDLQGHIEEIGKSNWPLMTHANGDQAISYTLQSYLSVFANGLEDRRNRIEHCSLLSDACVEQMSGPVKTYPSFLIGHVGYWGYAFKNKIFVNNDIKGKAKVDCLDLCQTLWQKVNYITLHSDSPVSPVGPLRLMEQAVTRKMEGAPEARLAGDASGELLKRYASDIPVLTPEEKLTPAQALTAATYNAAWQCHAEHLVGSLEVGKLADFAILDQDPLMLGNDDACYQTMRSIKVKGLWIKGEKVNLDA